MMSTYSRRVDSRRSALCLITGILATWAFAGSLALTTGSPALGPTAESPLPWQSPMPAGMLSALREFSWLQLCVLLAVTVAALGAPPLTAASRTSR